MQSACGKTFLSSSTSEPGETGAVRDHLKRGTSMETYSHGIEWMPFAQLEDLYRSWSEVHGPGTEKTCGRRTAL